MGSDPDDTDRDGLDDDSDKDIPLSTAAKAMGLGGLADSLDEGDDILKNAEDELENFDYMNDPLSDDEGDEDPWADDLMEEGEDKGLNDCPFG